MTKAASIIYACSGCSGAGQLAYKLALELDKRGKAEMSCLAGIAAEIPVFEKKINQRNVIVIDGCPIECAKGVFHKVQLPVHRHVRLHEMGIKKNECNPDEHVESLLEEILDEIKQAR